MPFFLLCPQFYSNGALVPAASVRRSESLVQSQRLNRGWGSMTGDIKETWDLASSTSSQKDHSSWAAGKALKQRHNALGSQRRTEADGQQSGMRGLRTGWPGVGTWGTRSRKRVVKQKALAVIMGHFFAEITQTRGLIRGKQHKHRTAALCQQHSISLHAVRNRVQQP